MFRSVRLGLNAELAVESVVESGFSSLPARSFTVGSVSMANCVGNDDCVPTVRLWNSVAAGAAIGFVTVVGGVVREGAILASGTGTGVATAGMAGTAVAVAAGGHWL